MRWRHFTDRFRSTANRLLASFGIAAVAGFVAFGLANCSRVWAQSAQGDGESSLSFEVASIKPDHSGDNRRMFSTGDPSRFTATNVTPKLIIEFAYDLKDFQVSGGPGWISSDKYDIEAKVDDALAAELAKLPRDQRVGRTKLMVQALLAQRFKLSVNRSTKESSVYALVIAKGGPKLTEATPAETTASTPQTAAAPPPPANRGGAPNSIQVAPGGGMVRMGAGGQVTLTGREIPVSTLADMLSRQLDREVLDQTGLKGNYDFTLQWTSDVSLGGGSLPPPAVSTDAPPPDSSGPSIFTALQEQLGLRLESTKGPVETIVIDSIEQPSEN